MKLTNGARCFRESIEANHGCSCLIDETNPLLTCARIAFLDLIQKPVKC
jgi:hypothetical protein